MKEDKVFVVECVFGKYEDVQTEIIGVFDDQEAANAVRDKLNAKAKEVQDNCPVDAKVLNLSEEDEATYISYYLKNTIFMNWQEASVLEYTINKEIELKNS